MRRTPSTFVDAWRPLPFSLPALGIGLRRLARVLAETRVQVAAGLLALALFTFIGVVREPVFVDEADNVLNACLMTRGALVYRDLFSHHFPAPYYALAALGEGGACSVLAGRVLGVVGLTLAAALFAVLARNALAPLALVVMGLVAPVYYLQHYLAETFIAIGLILTLATLTEAGGRRRGKIAQALRWLGLTILGSSSPLGLMMALVLLPLVVLRAGRPYTPTIAATRSGAPGLAGRPGPPGHAAGLRGPGDPVQHPDLWALPARPVDEPARAALGDALLRAAPLQLRDGLADRPGDQGDGGELRGRLRAAAGCAARQSPDRAPRRADLPARRPAAGAARRLARRLPPLAVRRARLLRLRPASATGPVAERSTPDPRRRPRPGRPPDLLLLPADPSR